MLHSPDPPPLRNLPFSPSGHRCAWRACIRRPSSPLNPSSAADPVRTLQVVLEADVERTLLMAEAAALQENADADGSRLAGEA